MDEGKPKRNAGKALAVMLLGLPAFALILAIAGRVIQGPPAPTPAPDPIFSLQSAYAAEMNLKLEEYGCKGCRASARADGTLLIVNPNGAPVATASLFLNNKKICKAWKSLKFTRLAVQADDSYSANRFYYAIN